MIQELGKPERRFSAPHYTADNDYLWLDARTIVFKVFATDIEFCTIDAFTGAMKLVATADEGVVDFGVSGAQRFWYKTVDGETHEVTVQSVKPPTPQ